MKLQKNKERDMKMEKNKFTKPEISIIALSDSDILTASTCADDKPKKFAGKAHEGEFIGKSF